MIYEYDRTQLRIDYPNLEFLSECADAYRILRKEFPDEIPEDFEGTEWWTDIARTEDGQFIAIGAEGALTADVWFYVVEVEKPKWQIRHASEWTGYLHADPDNPTPMLDENGKPVLLPVGALEESEPYWHCWPEALTDWKGLDSDDRPYITGWFVPQWMERWHHRIEVETSGTSLYVIGAARDISDAVESFWDSPMEPLDDISEEDRLEYEYIETEPYGDGDVRAIFQKKEKTDER